LQLPAHIWRVHFIEHPVPVQPSVRRSTFDLWTELDLRNCDVAHRLTSLAAFSHSELLRDLSAATIDTLVDLGSDSPLIMLELRQLGGALTQPASVLSPQDGT
jgi:hypothetical protein